MESPETYPPEAYEPEETPDRFAPDAAWYGDRAGQGPAVGASFFAVQDDPAPQIADLMDLLLIGLAVVALHLLHAAGIALPATVPESLVVIVLGSLATILVLLRVISIPDDFQPASRGIGIWISLIAAVAVIVAGLLRASEEL